MRDAKCRVLDVSIGHPGSTSDYLAFVTSSLHNKLERKFFWLLVCFFYGDNACVFNEHMVTPCKNVSSRSKDAFNFCQSQVRIRFECSFGIRWTIFKKTNAC